MSKKKQKKKGTVGGEGRRKKVVVYIAVAPRPRKGCVRHHVQKTDALINWLAIIHQTYERRLLLVEDGQRNKCYQSFRRSKLNG